jgi:hypothetical protein
MLFQFHFEDVKSKTGKVEKIDIFYFEYSNPYIPEFIIANIALNDCKAPYAWKLVGSFWVGWRR